MSCYYILVVDFQLSIQFDIKSVFIMCIAFYTIFLSSECDRVRALADICFVFLFANWHVSHMQHRTYLWWFDCFSLYITRLSVSYAKGMFPPIQAVKCHAFQSTPRIHDHVNKPKWKICRVFFCRTMPIIR